MSFVEFTVQSEGFEEWIFDMHHRFQQMVQTLIDIHNLIMAEMNAKSLIPLDFGYLEQSYHYNLVRQDESFIEIHSVFDPVDPDNGFHYAEYQHELEDRGMRGNLFYFGSPSYYYRALLGNPVGNHHRHGTRGTDHFLSEGVEMAMPTAWTMIETDYLSLFNGGIL